MFFDSRSTLGFRPPRQSRRLLPILLLLPICLFSSILVVSANTIPGNVGEIVDENERSDGANSSTVMIDEEIEGEGGSSPSSSTTGMVEYNTWWSSIRNLSSTAMVYGILMTGWIISVCCMEIYFQATGRVFVSPSLLEAD